MDSEGPKSFSIEELMKGSKEQRSQKIAALIRQRLSKILDVEEELINNDTSFFEIGMVSLTAEEFSQDLQSIFGDKCKISATTTFNYWTVELLTDYIESHLHSL